jgi:hypothetical protein
MNEWGYNFAIKITGWGNVNPSKFYDKTAHNVPE